MSSHSLLAADRPVPSVASRRRGRSGGLLVLAVALTASGCGWRAGQTAQDEQAPGLAVVRSATVATAARPLSRPLAMKVALTQRVPSSTPTSPAAVAPHLADFGSQRPSNEARHVANWAFDAWDNEGKAVVVVDKKAAKVYVFDPRGKLVAAAPALLGAAVGDDSVPGIGDKPLSQVLPEEKTTPAGRFVAEPGVNATGEDVVWVSWDLAVSMHRVRPLVKSERRLERLASPTARDNRISFGCINLPVAFYEKVLQPTVKRNGAIIYVLPETRTPHEQFGSYDVQGRAQLARKRQLLQAKKREPQLASLARPTVK